MKLEQNARRTALDVYAWDRVGRRLRDAYDALLVQPSRSVAVG
jgi:hypothetical protein